MFKLLTVGTSLNQIPLSPPACGCSTAAAGGALLLPLSFSPTAKECALPEGGVSGVRVRRASGGVEEMDLERVSGVGSLPGSIASLRSPVWCGVVGCLPLPRRLGGGLALLSPARRTWTSSSLWDVRRCVSTLACVRWSPRRRVVLRQRCLCSLGFGSWVKFFRVGWLVCHLFNRFVIIWKLALVFRAVLCDDCPELDWSLSFRSSLLTARLGTSYPSAVVGSFDSLGKVFPFLDWMQVRVSPLFHIIKIIIIIIGSSETAGNGILVSGFGVDLLDSLWCGLFSFPRFWSDCSKKEVSRGLQICVSAPILRRKRRCSAWLGFG
ncbi:hypothetical protein F2Q69_00027014 [Brassica cretica]|uniref:Uncharacterized protein n=1 Tax=Brassica cretica TaxID=69181 RepID=A0A8S9RSW8_BRACR|nr:hypothetical protein F2Q69_00027014 [Brassica cretica]